MQRYFVPLLAGLIVLAAPLAAQQTESMRVNADRVNLRKAPSIDSGIVRSLSKGTVVSIVARDGNWTKVQLPGQSTTGWVRSDLLVAAPAAPAASQGIKPSAAPPPPPAASPTPAHAVNSPPPAPAPRGAPPKPAPSPRDPGSVSADGSYHGGFTVFGGITMFKVTQTPSTFTAENASGFAAGAGIIAHLAGPIGIELDGLYVQEGVAVTAAGVKTTTHDNYGGGALLLRPAFGSGRVRVFVEGGAQAAYLLSCSYSGGTTCTVDSNDQNRLDYGAVVGGGVSFGPLAVQVRYDIGVANLSKVSGSTVKSNGLLVLGSLIL